MQLKDLIALEDLLQTLESTIEDHKQELALGGQVYTDLTALERGHAALSSYIQEN